MMPCKSALYGYSYCMWAFETCDASSLASEPNLLLHLCCRVHASLGKTLVGLHPCHQRLSFAETESLIRAIGRCHPHDVVIHAHSGHRTFRIPRNWDGTVRSSKNVDLSSRATTVTVTAQAEPAPLVLQSSSSSSINVSPLHLSTPGFPALAGSSTFNRLLTVK